MKKQLLHKKKMINIYKLFLFVFGLTIAPNLNAQNEKCATMHALEKRINKDSMVQVRMQNTELETQKWISKNKNNVKSDAVFTIPVVVHVLYNNQTQNISTAQIQSQIDALNEDFRLLNSDSLDVNHPFWYYTADTQIEFCLASLDPNGNPTSGITRTFTNISAFDGDGSEKFTSLGGKDNWDPTQYLNIWVCDLSASSGTLGYAQFPSDLDFYPDEDGVVIHHQAFGYLGTAGTGSYTANDMGRTATHEVGHWLNLSHIWGDNTCGNDFVSDTQIAEDANYGCPSFPHNDWSNCGSDEDGEMYMNYMDYVDDYCMVMFTFGQASRMHATLFGDRSELLNSNGCSSLSLNENSIENAFNLYPNPSNGEITFNSNWKGSEQINISVYDFLGSQIQQFDNVSFPKTVDFTDFPNGSYLVKFETNNQSFTTKLFITK